MPEDKKKKIQTKVILGEGKSKFYEEVCFSFPNDAKLYLVENVDHKLDVYHAEVVNEDTVILNYYLRKNIMYKTIENVEKSDVPCEEETTIEGDIKHVTKEFRFGGDIEIKVKDNEELKKGDIVEVLEAKVIGDVEKLLDPVEFKDTGIMQYCRLLEKMVILIKVKVVREKHLEIKKDLDCDC